jgi:hypothetical protein
MGCLRRLGCLAVLVVLAYGAWITRDRWRHWLPIGHGARSGVASADAREGDWSPVTTGGANHAEHLLLTLAERSGPVFASMPPEEFAAYMLMDVTGRIPPAADSMEAAIIDHRLTLRASADVKAMKARVPLGPLANVIGDRAPVSLAGTFDVVRPGTAEFRVEEIKLDGFPVPTPLIPEILHRIEIGAHPAGLAPDGLLLNVPSYIADIRVVGGRITLYKNVP